MNRRTLFGYLASKISQSPEDLATESLSSILQNKVAKGIFLKFIKQIGMEFGEDLVFRTQSKQEDDLRPDLVAKDRDGNQIIKIESKFWAGLTSSQPVSYLKGLPELKPGLVLFIAPDVRVPSLWAELARRCTENGTELISQSIEDSESKSHFRQINSYHSIALTSWRTLLNFIISHLEGEGLVEIASDAKQLQGLCEVMDTTGFIPIKSEELTPAIPKRIFQYMELVDKVYYKLASEGLANKRGLTKGRSNDYFATYFQISGVFAGLGYYILPGGEIKEKHRCGLIFGVKVLTRKEKLAQLEHSESSGLFLDDRLGLLIPLNLKLNVIEDDVIYDLISQIKYIIKLIND